MPKRNRLEIMRDILNIVSDNNNLKKTPLLRKSNISSSRFKKYYSELMEKKFITEFREKNNKKIKITEKGEKFLEKYKTIINFIQEFEL
jgi:predicted transcriptional regulator